MFTTGLTATTGLFNTVTLSSGQIVFPSIANVSLGANTLDDYEEGSWTPAFSGSITNPTVSYHGGVTYGRYVKIGKTVFHMMRIALSGMSSAGSGNLFVTGLPFSIASAEPYAQQTVGYRTGWTTRAPDCSYTQPNYINLIYTVDTGIAFITTANLNGSIDLMISGFYTTDS